MVVVMRVAARPIPHVCPRLTGIQGPLTFERMASQREDSARRPLDAPSGHPGQFQQAQQSGESLRVAEPRRQQQAWSYPWTRVSFIYCKAAVYGWLLLGQRMTGSRPQKPVPTRQIDLSGQSSGYVPRRLPLSSGLLIPSASALRLRSLQHHNAS